MKTAILASAAISAMNTLVSTDHQLPAVSEEAARGIVQAIMIPAAIILHKIIYAIIEDKSKGEEQ